MYDEEVKHNFMLREDGSALGYRGCGRDCLQDEGEDGVLCSGTLRTESREPKNRSTRGEHMGCLFPGVRLGRVHCLGLTGMHL